MGSHIRLLGRHPTAQLAPEEAAFAVMSRSTKDNAIRSAG